MGSKGTKGGKGERTQGQGAKVSGDLESITVGYERAGLGIEVRVGPEVAEITLGIGIAAVTLDLTNINESSISYAFDLYEITGRQEGCNLIVDFSIAGEVVKTEVRELPECKKEDPEPKEGEIDQDFDEDASDDDNFDEPDWEDNREDWNPFELIMAIIAIESNTRITNTYEDGDSTTTESWQKLSSLRIEEASYHPRYGIFIPRKIEAVVRDHNGNPVGLGFEQFYPLYGSELRDSNFFPLTKWPPDRSILVQGGLLGTIGPAWAVNRMVAGGKYKLIVNTAPGWTWHGDNLIRVMVGTKSEYRSNGWSEKEEISGNPVLGKTSFSRITKSKIRIAWSIKLESTYWPRTPGSPTDRMPKIPPNCCKEIKQIHRALGVKELLENKFYAPGRLIAPNAHQQQEMKTYLDIFQFLIRMADHLGIHPFKASLSDANAAKAGNQKVEAQLISGTAAMKKIVELLLENKGDAAVRLNLMVRSAVIQAQILNAVTIAAQSIKSVASFIGMPIKEQLSYIKMPFDVSLGARKAKGFDPKKTSQAIKVNTEAATEKILPKFLQSAEQPYTYEGYDGKQPSLIENIKGMGRKSQKQ